MRALLGCRMPPRVNRAEVVVCRMMGTEKSATMHLSLVEDQLRVLRDIWAVCLELNACIFWEGGGGVLASDVSITLTSACGTGRHGG